jgi:hypothetical protein
MDGDQRRVFKLPVCNFFSSSNHGLTGLHHPQDTVAWKSGYLWFVWLIGSFVIAPSLAGSLVQAEEIIRIHHSRLQLGYLSIH